jgi:hypothetical protein
MNISKALKVKNRLVGDINHRQALILSHNVRNAKNEPKVCTIDLLENLFLLRHKLVTLKGAISQASAPVAKELAELAETKSFAAWLATIPIKEQKEVASVGYGSQPTEVEWVSQITENRRQELLEKAKTIINDLQDKVDEFNATAQVHWNE